MSAPIIVGLDGSARGEDALALGRMLARTCDAPVLLAAIASGPRPSRGGASSAVERAGRALAGVTVAGTRVIRHPSSARGLARVAERDAGALVVIGASARGPAARLAPGGVLERLAHLAPCPVAVAPDGYWGNPGSICSGSGSPISPPLTAGAPWTPLSRSPGSAGARLRLLEAVPGALRRSRRGSRPRRISPRSRTGWANEPSSGTCSPARRRTRCSAPGAACGRDGSPRPARRAAVAECLGPRGA